MSNLLGSIGSVGSAIGSGITSSKNPITGKNGFTENSFKLGQNMMMSPFNLMSDVINNPTELYVLAGVGALIVVAILITEFKK